MPITSQSLQRSYDLLIEEQADIEAIFQQLCQQLAAFDPHFSTQPRSSFYSRTGFMSGSPQISQRVSPLLYSAVQTVVSSSSISTNIRHATAWFHSWGAMFDSSNHASVHVQTGLSPTNIDEVENFSLTTPPRVMQYLMQPHPAGHETYVTSPKGLIPINCVW